MLYMKIKSKKKKKIKDVAPDMMKTCQSSQHMSNKDHRALMEVTGGTFDKCAHTHECSVIIPPT